MWFFLNKHKHILEIDTIVIDLNRYNIDIFNFKYRLHFTMRPRRSFCIAFWKTKLTIYDEHILNILF